MWVSGMGCLGGEGGMCVGSWEGGWGVGEGVYIRRENVCGWAGGVLYVGGGGWDVSLTAPNNFCPS